MRKILVSLIIALLCNVCFAQEHLQIMGIPIDGNIETFKVKLEQQKGFKFENIPGLTADPNVMCIQNLIVKNGSFAGGPIRVMSLGGSPCSKTLCTVVLEIPFNKQEQAQHYVNRIIKKAEEKYCTSSKHRDQDLSLHFYKGYITIVNHKEPSTNLYFTNEWVSV